MKITVFPSFIRLSFWGLPLGLFLFLAAWLPFGQPQNAFAGKMENGIQTGTIQDSPFKNTDARHWLPTAQNNAIQTSGGDTVKTSPTSTAHTYTSRIFETEFLLNGAGIHWSGKQTETAPKFSLSFFDAQKESWSDWVPLDPIGEDAKDQSVKNYFYSRPVFTAPARQLRYRIETDQSASRASNNIKNVEIIYFNTETSKTLLTNLNAWAKNNLKGKNDAGPKIISRKDWGADESLRMNAQGKEIWPARKEPVTKFVVHHTAGGDGGEDPAATVRGIYYWHATVLGWGDIGYNFLIDTQGNIYEGRYGGDEVIGAHTYNSEREINYNIGSMGVSMLGCFEDDETDCANKDALTKKSRSALTSLLASKAASYKLDPKGSNVFFGETSFNILGHSDLDSTLCPGSNIHDNFASLRKETEKKYKKILGAKNPYEAKLIGHNITPAAFTGAKKEITLTLKNIGTETWNKEEFFLYVSDLGGQESKYKDKTWNKKDGKFRLSKEIVQTEENTTFTFMIKTPDAPGKYKNIFQLRKNEETILGGEFFFVTRADAHYKAKLIEQNIPVALLTSWKPRVIMKFENTGIASWEKDTALFVEDLGENQSKFYSKEWPKKRIAAYLEERQVKPGEVGTFIFSFTSPETPGLYLNNFFMSNEKRNLFIQGGKFLRITRVDEGRGVKQ